MNFLAHLLLSGSDEDAILGSLLGDFVRGRTEGRFSPAVSRAIQLHRRIDSFADAHDIPRRSRSRVSPSMRRFAGVIVDMAYDHFLSRHWSRFDSTELSVFVERVHAVLKRSNPQMPERMRRVVPRMIAENWLGGYIHLEKVGLALDRIAGRLSRGERFRCSVEEIEAHYAALEMDFLQFFPEMVLACRRWKLETEGAAAGAAG